MPYVPRPGRVVVAEARLGRQVVSIEADVAILEVSEHLPEAPPTQEVKMAEPTTAPELPDPAEVARTWETMRASVISAYEVHADDIAAAREIISAAEEEQAKLRSDYPMFFPAEQEESSRMSHPSIEVKNQVLRTLADHPDQTLKQLSRRVSWSRSWVGRILQVIMEEHVTDAGPIVERQRRGREFQYRLTSAGTTLVGRGGLREE